MFDVWPRFTVNSLVVWLAAWWAARPTHSKVLLVLACSVLLVEILLRTVARKSRFYAAWTRFFEAVGHVWSVVLLSFVYVLSVGPVGIVMRLAGHDPLDRKLDPEPTWWRAHEPNPMGPEAAARVQF
jgi:hypothetical protein